MVLSLCGWFLLLFGMFDYRYVALIPSVGNLSGIRALRVLRALRAINALPGLRIMVNSLLSSLQAIVSVFILMFCFIIMVAILGLQLFSGVLRHKCVLSPEGDMNLTSSMNMSTMMMSLAETTMSPVTTSTPFHYSDFVNNASKSVCAFPVILACYVGAIIYIWLLLVGLWRMFLLPFLLKLLTVLFRPL